MLSLTFLFFFTVICIRITTLFGDKNHRTVFNAWLQLVMRGEVHHKQKQCGLKTAEGVVRRPPPRYIPSDSNPHLPPQTARRRYFHPGSPPPQPLCPTPSTNTRRGCLFNGCNMSLSSISKQNIILTNFFIFFIYD